MSLKVNSIPVLTTDYLRLPSGLTTEQPTLPKTGMFRVNTNGAFLEVFSTSEIVTTTNIWRSIKFVEPIPDTLNFVLQRDTGVSNTDNITSNGTISVSGINVINGTWKYSTDSGMSWSAAQPTSTTTFTLLDGTYPANSIKVIQTNAVGYSSVPAINPTDIIIDSVHPVIIIDTISTDNVLTYADVNTTYITGTVSEVVSSITLTFNTTIRTATISGLTWSYLITEADLIALGEGTGKIITASASDFAGNTGSATAVVTVSTWGSVTLTSSRSWTPPLPGITKVHVIAVGGGSGGFGFYGSGGWTVSGSGGGAGWKNNIPVISTSSYSVVVGSGGTGAGKNAGGRVTAGGSSNFAAVVYGYGAAAPTVDAKYGVNSVPAPGGSYTGDGGWTGGMGTHTYMGASAGGASPYKGYGKGGDAAYSMSTLAYGSPGDNGVVIIKWGIGRTYAN